MPIEQKPRQTIRNFTSLISGGHFLEIFKVLRRRFLNSLKPVRRGIGSIYDNPLLLRPRQRKLLRQMLSSYYSYDLNQPAKAGLNVALIVRDGTSHPKSSAFIRLIGPLSQPLLKAKLTFKLFDENTADLNGDYQVCIVQRTAFDDTATAQKLIDGLEASNTSLVVDTDDAFHSMNADHPEHAIQATRAEALTLLLSSADQVWVSTSQLKSHLPQTRQPAVIMENCLDARVWQKTTPRQQSTGPVEILYMGTSTHDADLAMILPALDKLAQSYPNSFNLTVMGVASDLPARPWLKKLPQHRHQSIYPGFVSWFLQQGPFDIGLSPLVDSEFNRDKSDIKCLDYIAAGILPVVSDVAAYSTPELKDFIIKVTNTPEAWYQNLVDLVSKPETLRQKQNIILPKAQQYVWSARSGQLAASKMLQQLESLQKTT